MSKFVDPKTKQNPYSFLTILTSNNFLKKKYHNPNLPSQVYIYLTLFPFGHVILNPTDSHQCIRAEQKKKSAKTAEWHCVCRYVSWALVFHNGDANVTSLVKPDLSHSLILNISYLSSFHIIQTHNQQTNKPTNQQTNTN